MARPTRRRGNLPAEATSFVGRRRELAELRKKLATVRLVTLVGPGGVGKTRLAIRIGTDLARAFPDGAWLVELADVRDPSLVQNAILAALDLRDQAATGPRAVLLSYLKDKELLLLVDNCEHLLDAAAALVADIVRVAPGVRVIATSREPLAVPGEHLLLVPPLELPRDAPGEPLELLRLNESVELFVERASAASGGFALTDANRAAVIDVCRRLDGLPLAIELAAVRTRVLAVEQIRDRLADRFGLLAGTGRGTLPRHQTLRLAIEWSHDLLTPEERTLLRRLSVFAGRFTLEDVEAVCAADDMPQRDALDPVASLVDKSLVTADVTRGVACYRLHETMREFARLRLREAGEEDAVEERCVSYFVSRCHSGWEDPRYDLGAWHIISLNGNVSMKPGSAQANWLRQDLESSQARCTLAYWHQPLFSSSTNGNNAASRDAWQILYEFGAEVVLNGHDHLFERFAPQDPSGRLDLANGIRQFTVGTGGCFLYNVVRLQPNSEMQASVHGVLKLTLRAGAYDWQFVPIAGTSFSDVGTGSCH